MKKVIKLEMILPPIVERTRTAAYVRVSSDKDAMLHSLSAQISYFNDYIQRNPEYEFAGVSHFNSLASTGAVSTANQNQASPPAFELSYIGVNETTYTVTIPATDGAEYSFDGTNRIQANDCETRI